MKKTIITLALALFAPLAGLRADTSYLLIQGPFGSGGAEETFKWQVNYQAGTLQTGQDLLNSVFGAPTLSGTYSDNFAGVYNNWVAGNSTTGADYIDYGTNPSVLAEPFTIAFTLAGTTVEQDASYINTWSYYVAGGGGADGSDNNGAPYANNGSWIFSNDGSSTRTLANGSFDAWVFGSSSDAPTIAGSNNAPLVANFVPEPTSAGLLVFGAGGVLALMKRRRA